jgi:hypothetical protein
MYNYRRLSIIVFLSFRSGQTALGALEFHEE